MKKQTLYLLAGGAALAAWWYFRKTGPSGGGSASGGGGGGGVQSSGAAPGSFTTNVVPGGGGVMGSLARSVGTSGLQSGIALAGDIGGLLKGVGQIGKDIWSGISSAATGAYNLVAGDWRLTPEERMVRSGVTIVGGDPLGEWMAANPQIYTPGGSNLASRSFSLDEPTVAVPALNWGTADNVVYPFGYPSPWGDTLSYSDAPYDY